MIVLEHPAIGGLLGATRWATEGNFVQGKVTVRRLGAGMVALVLATGMSACTTAATPAGTGGLAVIVGGHSNMPRAAVAGKVAAARDRAVSTDATVAILVADGAPFVLQAGRLQARSSNSEIQQRDREQNRTMIDTDVLNARARTRETNLLGALDLAAREISSAPGDHTIVALDSGLSTVAPLDFTQPGLLDSDPTELATSLKNARELPDLTGDAVVFQGLGDTAAPQEKVGRPQRVSLIDIWTAIARAAGARDVRIEESPLVGAPTSGLPPVTPVRLGTGLTCSGSVVTLTGGDVAFQADSAVFKDGAAAKALVMPIAKQLQDAHVTATLTGTTANVGAKPGQRDLSEQRARAVAALLVDLGVPADRLTSFGRGSDFPGYVPDHDAAGNLIPAAAAMNRKVTIELSGTPSGGLCS